MSAVVKTADASVTTPVESAIEPAEVPSLAFKLVTSRFVESTVVAVKVVADPVVKVPAAGVAPPITVLSNVPPFISAVVRTAEATVITPVASAMVAEAVPSFAFRLVTSSVVASITPMLAVPVTPKLDDKMVAPPTVSAPDKLSAEPVTEDERITAELNVAVPVTFTPESIVAVVTTIFEEVRVSPEDPSIKSRVWERKALRELFTSEGAIPSPMLIPSISVLSPGVAEYSEYFVRGII
jgi:hypothetical protein